MNLFWAIVFLISGLAVLCKCADVMVTGAVGMARRFDVSPMVIGLTIVAMGTSAPEVAASIAATLKGIGDTALGNVYGSNIANLALVGGFCALLRPLRVRSLTLKREIPVMLLTALLLWPVLRNLWVSRLEGAALLLVFAVLILLTVYLARRQPSAYTQQEPSTLDALGRSVIFVAVGLVGLAVGADLALRGAVFIGDMMGLSKAVIGLTIVAVGTSLPELATSTVAALRGHHDISIGNLVGSNIFNTLLVTGVAGVVKPFSLSARLTGSDLWIMIAVSGLFTLVVLLGRRVLGRIGGIALLLTYAAFIAYTLIYTRTV